MRCVTQAQDDPTPSGAVALRGVAGIVLRRFGPTLVAPNPLNERRNANMPDFSNLPASEQAKRYHQLAEDALREADRAGGAVRQSYLLIAEQWNRLARIAGARPDISEAS